jgi:hypothetical protein
MATLAERLLEAIEADELYAGVAGEADDNWEYRRGADVRPAPDDGVEALFDGGISWHPGKPQVIFTYWEEDGEHIVRHQPSRVRLRCAADRAIVERCTERRDGFALAQFVLERLAEAYGVPLEQEETNDGPQARG